MSGSGVSVSVGKTNAAILRGGADYSDWDDEEIEQGRRRDKNGGWSGRKPVVVAAGLLVERRRRGTDTATAKLATKASPAIDVLSEIIHDTREPAETRLRAIEIMLSWSIPKPTANVNIRSAVATDESDPPARWELSIDAGIVALPSDHDVIDTTARAIPVYKDDEVPTRPRKPNRASNE